MKNWWQKNLPFRIALAVFGAGAGVMVLELAGSRVMAPQFGTSIITWTSLIGVIMTSLALGYFIGGRLADRHQSIQLLATLLFIASLAVVWTAWSSFAIMPRLVSRNNFILYNVINSALMFVPASLVLAMISPVAVRLSLKQLDRSGALIGAYSALSTAGSIAGTFLAGFILIPLLGTDLILFVLALWLLLLAVLVWSAGIKKLFICLIVAMLFLLLAFASKSKNGLVADIDTLYNRVWVSDLASSRWGEEPIRLMQINNEISSGIYLTKNDLLFPYTSYYDLGEYFKPAFKRGLLLGGAGYSYAKHFLERYGEAELDVVEIDPGLTKLARQYFQLRDDPRLKIIHDDARIFLNQNTTKYDVVYGDAFVSLSLPFHLTTIETVAKIKDSLSDDGVVLVNLISAISGPKGQLAQAEYATFSLLFPQVYLIGVSHPNEATVVQNVMLIALKSPKIPNWRSDNPRLMSYLESRYRGPMPTATILTDNYAPVEYYTAKLLAR